MSDKGEDGGHFGSRSELSLSGEYLRSIIGKKLNE
jgi:hypothetical protein